MATLTLNLTLTLTLTIGWRVETMDAVPRATRAVGSYWQPNMVWNPHTRLWVLWWVFSGPNASPSDTIAQAGGWWGLVSVLVSWLVSWLVLK